MIKAKEMRQVVHAVRESSIRMGISYLDYADNFKLFFQHACLVLRERRWASDRGTNRADFEYLEMVAKLRHMDDWLPPYISE